MGLSRRLKRKTDSEHQKKMKKAARNAAREYRAQKFAKANAEATARGNIDRMEKYIKAYYYPQMIAIMHDEFGYGFDRIGRLDKDIAYCIDYYGKRNEQGEPVIYIDDTIAQWHKIGFEFEMMQTEEPPQDASEDELLTIYAKRILKDLISTYEVMWLSALNFKHGFGGKRLTKAHASFREMLLTHRNGEQFAELLERLEKIRKGKDNLCFSWERKVLHKIARTEDMSYTVVRGLRKGA